MLVLSLKREAKSALAPFTSPLFFDQGRRHIFGKNRVPFCHLGPKVLDFTYPGPPDFTKTEPPYFTLTGPYDFTGI